ncbi:hypothetical protein ACNCTR_002948, partial [Escherichia coli]
DIVSNLPDLAMKLRALLKTGHFLSFECVFNVGFCRDFTGSFLVFQICMTVRRGFSTRLLVHLIQHRRLRQEATLYAHRPSVCDQIIYCESPSRFSISLFTQSFTSG